MSKWLTASEFEDALADTAHTLASVEIATRWEEEKITFIHLHLSNGRELTISSDSGADLAVEEKV